MSDIVIVNRYSRRPEIVWAALTDPALVPLWTSTGQGARPEGFEPTLGTRFRFVGKPVPGWDGIVHCEITAVDEPRLLRYSWRNKEGDTPTEVTYELAPDADGTLFTYRHTGFRGVEGIVMSRLLGRIRRKMLRTGLPRVLSELTDDGTLRHSNTPSPDC